MENQKYEDFIRSKVKNIQDSGFEVSESDLNKNLFDFQKHIVKLALKKGRYAIFADTGLGKTLMQLAWAYQVGKHTGKPVLILAPLAVSGQTINEGKKFSIEVEKFNTSIVNPENSLNGIYISNYEQLDNIDCSIFSGVVLDESSILKNFTGKIKNKIIDSFQNTPYKLACTATPSPNDLMELGNHSEFLSRMTRNEMLSMYFVHDGGETAKWRIKNHAKKNFYSWIGEWASVLVNPKDLGYDGKAFDLPNLNYREYQVVTDKKDNGMLFNDIAVNATGFNKELRLTKVERMDRVKAIIDELKDQYCIIWVNQNEEADLIKKMLKGYDFREVRGSDKPEIKEKNLIEFGQKKYKILITKSKIAGMGLNYQHCSNQIFASLDFSFEKLYQAIRRSYRFGQIKDVDVYLITTDTMQNVIKTIKNKEIMFNDMRDEMKNIINNTNIGTNINHSHDDFKSDNCTILKGDCIERIKEIEDESIGFSVFSPPFSDLYVYSDKVEDIGNVRNYDEYFKHFKYLIPELYRILKQGRNIAIHCMDLPIQKGKEGFIGLRDYTGDLIKEFSKVGFIYYSRVTIWKNPVIEMQRTKALGLLHKQLRKDATMSRVGIPDYLLIFRKDGERNDPVNLNIDVDTWQQWASPVWMDINYSNTLQYTTARDNADEKHICPLQLDTIKRSIALWSNENDTVFSPFAGIGSELYQALKMKRKAIGIELKDSYFNIAVDNVKSVLAEQTLF